MTAFSLLAQDGQARAGRLETSHGPVETPVFMPVGTQATVKSLAVSDLQALGAKIILGNTYHLALAPGRRPGGRAGGPAPLHGLSRRDPHRLGRLSGFQSGGAPEDRRRRRDLLVPPRRQRAALHARARDGGAGRAGQRHRHGVRRMPTLGCSARRWCKPRWIAPRAGRDRCLEAPRPPGQLRFGIVQGGVDVRAAAGPPGRDGAAGLRRVWRWADWAWASHRRSCTRCWTPSRPRCRPIDRAI